MQAAVIPVPSEVVIGDPSFKQDHCLDKASALDEDADIAAQQPIYVIAHRVLTTQGVRDALSHGANAIEIDMYAWKSGWWADHDGLAKSGNTTAKDMFIEIANQRRAGKPVTFVWLDIKNQDWCDPNSSKWRYCSVAGLRDLARDHLEPAGVRVLFKFYGPEGTGYKTIVDGLNKYEAASLDGDSKDVLFSFDKNGPKAQSQRVMSKGLFNMKFNWDIIFRELKTASQSQRFGKVFGWTIQAEQEWYVDKMMGAGVDGLIYGFEKTYYYDHTWTRSACQDIIRWVEKNSGSKRVATINDTPW